jgi:hypothetical protein
MEIWWHIIVHSWPTNHNQPLVKQWGTPNNKPSNPHIRVGDLRDRFSFSPSQGNRFPSQTCRGKWTLPTFVGSRILLARCARCARSFLADTHCGSMALHLSSNISAPEAEHQTISDSPHFLWGDPKWWVNMMKKTCLIKMVQVVWWTLVNLVKGSCRGTTGKKRPWKSGTSIMRNSTKSIYSYARWVPRTIDLVYN